MVIRQVTTAARRELHLDQADVLAVMAEVTASSIARATGRLIEQRWSSGARADGDRWVLELSLPLEEDEGDRLFGMLAAVGPSTSPTWECGDDEGPEFV